MAIGRITGPMLFSNLDRQGVDLAIDGNLAFFDVNNRYVGISTATPNYLLDVNGNANISGALIVHNTSSFLGNISVGNIVLTGNITTNGNTNYISGNIGQFFGNAAGFGALYAGVNSGYVYQPQTVLQNSTNFNGYAQVNHQNINNGSAASTDYVATADTGTADAGYIDMGINSSGFVGGVGNELNNPLDGYLYVQGTSGLNGNLLIGTGTASDIVFSTGGFSTTNNYQGRFKNNVGLILAQTTSSTSTTSGALQVTGGIGIAGNAYINNIYTTNGLNWSANGVSALYGNTNVSTYLASNTDPTISNIFSTLSTINTEFSEINGNTITLGANTVQAFISNAVTFTQSTTVTNAIAELNYVLGKLVPPSPPNFPNSTTISVGTTNSGLMCNFTQTDNSGWGNLSVAGGTLVSTLRASSFSTIGTPITNVGPGSTGTITTYVNGVPNGNVTLTGSNGNTLNGNLYVYNVEDYHSVVSTVTAGFWTVFSAYATAGAGKSPGWNRVHISDSATGNQTNDATWYYDSSSPSAPSFSGTSMVLSSNVVQYSSTIPMFTTSAGFTLKGNVQNISGDTYPNSTNLISSSAANGAFAAPALVSYAAAGVTTPITRNNTAVVSFTTTANITSGFGNSLGTAGPSVTVNNGYNSTGWAFSAPATYILYKTGTGIQIEETAITNSYTGGSAAYRIVNPDAGTAADNPSYTGSEAAFNSTTGPFYTTDATNVAAKIQFDQTNYSTGFLPVGPNLSGHSSTQYFTFKFVKSAVSKFNISYTGTIAGLWVALPGSTIDTTASPTHGWINMAQAYAGSGVPGTGTGGNGSTGCSTGGAAVLNSLVSGGSYTCTFGTASSTNSTNNEIYVRIKLTSGQSLAALSIANPTN